MSPHKKRLKAAQILLGWALGRMCRCDALARLRQLGARDLRSSWANNDGIERIGHWRSPWAAARNARLNGRRPDEVARDLAQELWGEP